MSPFRTASIKTDEVRSLASDSDEGRKTVYKKTGPVVPAGGVVSLQACLASCICLALSFYTFSYFRGTLLALHFFLWGGGGAGNCHMNYSIIFTEISFSPETSNYKFLYVSIL